MPAGKYWNPTLHKWVKRGQARDIDYDNMDDSESWALLISYWRWYPDRMLAILESEDSDYSLTLIQTLNIRIMTRYQQTFITGSRGTTKTYGSFLEKMCEGILWPGELMRYFGPSLKQTADIASATFEQIRKNYPALAGHWLKTQNAKETFEMKTDTGSVFAITTMRGDNSHQVLCEEVGQEEQPVFNHRDYRNIVLPSVRLRHQVNKQPDTLHIDFKKQYITSACRQQNETYQYRCDILKAMMNGESAFIIDYPWEVAVLSRIRDLSWAEDLRRKLTPDEWMREMESRYTGVSENSVIRDEVLSESKKVTVMETHHCQDPNAIYIIGYDVSYEEGARHAKCALAVLKLTRQTGRGKQDVYLKQLVYVNDMIPQEAELQAIHLKDVYRRYSMDGGAGTYIAIDNRQYGKSVTEQLMKDMGDGMPICCWNHDYAELELRDALPVIYPVRASNGYTETGHSDPDAEMLKYAQMQFENGNVQILITNIYEGIEAYKAYHNLPTSDEDATFAIPYGKCREMCGQIMNLKKKASRMNWVETRISNSIQRDMWSALKYALRFAQLLERKNLIDSVNKDIDWTPLKAKITQNRAQQRLPYRTRVVGWKGGRQAW